MQALLTREEARAHDRVASDVIGLPSIVLMENAARGAVEVLLREFGHCLERVVIIGGEGNNGGDAWAVARLLTASCVAVPHAMLVGSESKLTADAMTNWNALGKLAVARTVVEGSHEELSALICNATLIVDGLFGTGLARLVEGHHVQIIKAINRIRSTGVPVVALDIPSGVDSNTGAVLGAAVQASVTVTFGGSKLGLFQYPGKQCAGRVVPAHIGVPTETTAATMLYTLEDCHRAIPKRREDAHKASAGWVAVVGGSNGKAGAPVLAGMGCLRSGAGIVTIFTESATRAAIEAKALELMVEEIEFEESSIMGCITQYRPRMGSAIVGPGLGLSAAAQQSALRLYTELNVPAVFDADALTHIAGSGSLKSVAERVLTPHPGEAARLLGVSVEQVQSNRIAAARSIAERYDCVTVLKGASTVVATAAGTGANTGAAAGRTATRVIATGSPVLATAGTGDVLAGVIGALLLEMSPFEAACAGACLHGAAGMHVATRSGRGALAHEIADAIPEVM